MRSISTAGIGIFDSGVGGLTVLREAMRLLPQEQFVYLGDTARVPYGTKSPETVINYALQAAGFLVRQRIKLLVVACNTASAVALPRLAAHYRLPVVGVIEPGARRAAAASAGGRIGVIGTEGTVRSGAYERVIRAARPAARVISTACPLFVPLAEEGWAEHRMARIAAEEYLAPLVREKIDTLVLGCTHYPLLGPVLRDVLGPGVRLVDSAESTALAVRELLVTRGQLNCSEGTPPRFYVSDLPERFCRVGRAFLGSVLEDVCQVDLGSCAANQGDPAAGTLLARAGGGA